MDTAAILKLAQNLPALLDLYTAFESALVATKGESPVARDFDILIALLPKLKAVAISVEANLAVPPAA
jgi:hypothetical protein